MRGLSVIAVGTAVLAMTAAIATAQGAANPDQKFVMEAAGGGAAEVELGKLATDRPTALRQAIQACRKGGTVSIPGVYGGFLDKMPFGAAFGKGLTFKMGQTHVMKYLKPLLARIEKGEIDPSFVITHRLPIDEAANAYKMFRDQRDECIKVVLKPH